MNVLIDTHTFLWFVNDDPQLSETAAALLEADTNVLLSIASVWEIAIKATLGKLSLPKPFADFIPEQLVFNDITLLPIQVTDCERINTWTDLC